MAEFATRAQLRSIASRLTLNEQTLLRKSAPLRVGASSAFLSHSSKDQDIVAGAALLLRDHGASIYVDEVDPDMPPYTTAATADLLKTRIKENSRFILLVTKNSKESRWVPWELGIADGYKSGRHIALFPSADSAHDTAWAEVEYFGLYLRIEHGLLGRSPNPVWMVRDHALNTGTELSAWLAGG